MPIVDHNKAPETPWRPRYRKFDIAGHEQGVTSTLSINLNRSQGEMRIWEEVKQWSTSVSQVQVEELQRVT